MKILFFQPSAFRPHPATHSLTSVVLPKPAGAEMRVSLRPKPGFGETLVQALDQAGAEDNFRPRRWDIKFRG